MFKKRLGCCTVLRPDHNLKIKALCHLAGADKAGTQRPTDYRVFSSLAAPCTGHELTITSCSVDNRPGGGNCQWVYFKMELARQLTTPSSDCPMTLAG